MNSLLLEAGEIYSLDKVCSQMFEGMFNCIAVTVAEYLMFAMEILFWYFFKGFVVCDFILFLG